ncbi:unnamed protein product [Thelazia callipaeda]|uniref:E2F_CC-MB domain-containing protein n=1 Tax=Thelazia callipaeda TaxID=103827 RepID=A0A0N5CKZ0_THECL|nr:unnamed protein product [Thelazia callipaeda]
MSIPSDRHAAAVSRLQDLEEELRDAGAICPPDTAVSDVVANALATASPNSDIQIRVNSSRQVTTTKSVFETETPGMTGASAVPPLSTELDASTELKFLITDSFYFEVTDQKHESVAEGFASDDGSVVVSKKMTRIVTTTKTIPGEKNESNAGSVNPRAKPIVIAEQQHREMDHSC